MSMEALILLGSATIGYLLNKDGKQDRSPSQQVDIPDSSKPTGPLIYESHRVQEVDEYQRGLAVGKAQQRIKQMYPDTYMQPNSIMSSSTVDNSNSYASLSDLSGSAQNFFDSSQTGITNPNILPFDPQTGSAITKKMNSLMNDTAFHTYNFKGPKVDASQQLSSLTGLPLDMVHGNMQPFYGGSVKQQGLKNENGQVLLERFTGIPSSDNYGTYSQRQELPLAPPSNPDNVRRPGYSQVPDARSRVQASVRPTNEYITPVKSVRDLPINQNVQVYPKGIDETRREGGQQISYTVPVIEGQKGSNRGMLPNIQDNKWSLFTEIAANDTFGNRSDLTSQKQRPNTSIFETKGTLEYAQDYTGPSNSQIKSDSSQQLSESQIAKLKDSLFNPLIYTPEFGIASGPDSKSQRTQGVILLNNPLSDKEENYMGVGYKNSGFRDQDINSPELTVKSTYPKDQNAGTLNPKGDAAGLYTDTMYDAPITNKEMSGDNKYIGQPHRDQGQGGRDTDYSLEATLKEMNLHDQTGNPSAQVAAGVDTDREFTNLGAELFMSDYYPIPGISNSGKEVYRAETKKGYTKSTNKPEFGNYFTAGKDSKQGELNRDIQTLIKEDTTVEGRAGPALKRDNKKSPLSMDVQFKEDTPHKATTFSRKLPTVAEVNNASINTKARNTEVINPRFDPMIKVTSDLFPYM